MVGRFANAPLAPSVAPVVDTLLFCQRPPTLTDWTSYGGVKRNLPWGLEVFWTLPTP